MHPQLQPPAAPADLLSEGFPVGDYPARVVIPVATEIATDRLGLCDDILVSLCCTTF